MSDIQSEYVELSVADGGTMRAWFSRPAKQEVRAGLMVFQEAFGVNAHIRSVADRFAKAGFAAIAPELYHRSSPGFESGYDDAAPAIALARQLTTEGLEADIRATHAFLRDQGSDNMACVGYCMGGRVCVPGQYSRADPCGDFFLRWGARRGHSPRLRLLRAHAVLLGRERQAHHRGTSPESRGRNACIQTAVGTGYILRRGPRVFLRPARQLQPCGREVVLGSDIVVLRTVPIESQQTSLELSSRVGGPGPRRAPLLRLLG